MQVARDIAAIRAWIAERRAAARSIGFVPTMGALHAGHVSLVDAARADGHAVVVSIYVNPMQFAPHEDFARYPRPRDADLALCERAGVAAVFLPAVDEMNPRGAMTRIDVPPLSAGLCGPLRPGHFVGVATIVAKLLCITLPDAAYFGEKDFQQLAIIRRMVADLSIPVRIVGCPTVREPDGLAASSRNAYLSPAERTQAASLYAALSECRQRVAQGQRDAATLIQAMRERILAAGPAEIEYASLVDPTRLSPLARVDGPAQAVLAVRIGHTRLIDNLRVDPGAAEP